MLALLRPAHLFGIEALVSHRMMSARHNLPHSNKLVSLSYPHLGRLSHRAQRDL
jgi:hypothetical protein